MISVNRVRKRMSKTSNISIWSEAKDNGGYIIYHGIRGTETKTIVGGAASSDSLDYNMRKAKHRYGYKL